MTNETPHTTSIAVWDVPSPVVMSRAFTVKVGLTCSAACALTGQPIVVRDGNGIKVGEGKVGETLSPGTSALYGADVDLVAPGEAGVWSWSVVFAGTQGPMPPRGRVRKLRFPDRQGTPTPGHGEGPRQGHAGAD